MEEEKGGSSGSPGGRRGRSLQVPRCTLEWEEMDGSPGALRLTRGEAGEEGNTGARREEREGGTLGAPGRTIGWE